MNRKEDKDEVLRRIGQQVRHTNHSVSYYFCLALLFFAIPLYIFLQFFYVYAHGWQLFDFVLLFVLLAVAIYGIYKELSSTSKLAVWFTVVGTIAGVVVTVVGFVI